ncbi:MAG: class I SAM-dependent methyltransferase [Candidatus Omnitrophota bacterium]
MIEFYKDDLSYIHDIGFGRFAEESAPGLLEILRKKGIKNGRIIDLGCGSGIWASELVKAGYGVVGVDLSPSMIGMAQERVPEGIFHNTSFLKFKIPPCVAVTAIGEIFNYMFDETNCKKELTRLFKRVHQALAPGGCFIFDLASPGRGTNIPNRFWEGEDWAILVKIDENREENILTRHITTFRKDKTLYRRDHEIHRQQLYTPSEIIDELQHAGFQVRTLRGYGQHRFPRAHVGFIARKPA